MIKSTLHEFPKNIVLGAMLDVVERLTDNDFFYQCQQRGDAAFAEVSEADGVSEVNEPHKTGNTANSDT